MCVAGIAHHAIERMAELTEESHCSSRQAWKQCLATLDTFG